MMLYNANGDISHAVDRDIVLFSKEATATLKTEVQAEAAGDLESAMFDQFGGGSFAPSSAQSASGYPQRLIIYQGRTSRDPDQCSLAPQ